MTKTEERRMYKLIRAYVGARGTSYPIEFVDGYKEPVLLGRSYHWTTPGGREVYSPNAYRRAWGKPVYVASTLHIVVGKGWGETRLLLDDDTPDEIVADFIADKTNV